ncbi:PIG-L family deacetylase [Rhodobacterales bacterium LSUCC0031]|nr:PIG-L family deacetylase [Rhodobacterales bacterium LSUCC0031]
MRILALGAHPDDLEIYAWGSLCAWAAMGAELVLAIATDGAAGGRMPPEKLVQRRTAEAMAAATALGQHPVFLGFADGGLSTEPHLLSRLIALIAETAPDLVISHAPNDYHADHRALSMAANQACGFSVPFMEMDTMGGTGFSPNIWIDIGPYWAAKCTAIRCHESQDPERFVTMANRQAAFRAGQANGLNDHRAEAFRFEPRFPFADIRALLPPAPALRAIGHRGKS